MQKIEIFTDGACRGNPGPGGWAFAIFDGKKILAENSGGFRATTNNRMEIFAAIAALEFFEKNFAEIFAAAEIKIFTDSKFLKNGAEIWLPNWQKNGWRTAAKKPVKNPDLWKKLAEILTKKKIFWQHVPAHRGIPRNEKVDRAAAAAARRENLPSEILPKNPQLQIFDF